MSSFDLSHALGRAKQRILEGAKSVAAFAVVAGFGVAADILTDVSTSTAGLVSAVTGAAAVWFKRNKPAAK